jgi:hypothetical protein
MPTVVILHLVYPVSANWSTAVLNNHLNSTVSGSLNHLTQDTTTTLVTLKDASGAQEAGRSKRDFSRGVASFSPRTRYTGNVKNQPGAKVAFGNARMICKSTATFMVKTFSPPLPALSLKIGPRSTLLYSKNTCSENSLPKAMLCMLSLVFFGS